MARRRRRIPTKIRVLRAVIILVVIAATYAIKSQADHNEPGKEGEVNTSHVTLDRDSSINPTAVRTNPDLTDKQLHYAGMDVSFNQQMHVPNWVAWELTAEETDGNVKRSTKFIPDVDVAGCADPSDYTNSGYDRGHMAPAGDMKWSPDAMSHTFYMTNICPQAKTLNTGTWKALEEKCRQWAKAEGTLFIVCGPVLTDTITEFIGRTRVAVPQRFFKVIIAPYAEPARGIGFIMNNGKVNGGMQKAAVSIDEVEKITGHDFFWQLPDSIEDVIEAQCDFNFWNTVR